MSLPKGRGCIDYRATLHPWLILTCHATNTSLTAGRYRHTAARDRSAADVPDQEEATVHERFDAGAGLTVVESIEVTDLTGRTRLFQLAVGDVTAATPAEPIDLLVVSAFPGDYSPVPGTVIGCLHGLGIDVQSLFQKRERDWVASWQCWVSAAIMSGPPAAIRRLLCFEHGLYGPPEELVGNVFRSIREWLLSSRQNGDAAATGTGTESLRTVRMPLLSTGKQKHAPASMLDAITEQALVHLRAGLPVGRIQLVIRPAHPDLHRLLVAFGKCTAPERLPSLLGQANASSISNDLFLSYRRSDEAITRALETAIKAKRDSVRFFIDQHAIPPGTHWKPALLDALAESRHAMCVVTDGYGDSRECIDEFHGAIYLQRSRPGYLLPLLCLQERTIAHLPSSLRGINFLPASCPPASLDAVADSILRHMDRHSPPATGST